MANSDHVALLKKSVEAWNDWRSEKPRVRPDLIGADLRGANLTDVDLRGGRVRFKELLPQQHQDLCRSERSDRIRQSAGV